MKKLLFIWVFVLLATGVSAQKSRVVSAVQMIEKKKYEEAKEAIELAVWNDKTSSWARTYYVRGLLCQTAFEDGFEKREVKKTTICGGSGPICDGLWRARTHFVTSLRVPCPSSKFS